MTRTEAPKKGLGRIVLHTELHEGIYQSDREYWADKDESFPNGPRGRIWAWDAYCERCKRMEQSFGGIGMGSTRLYLGGQDITEDLGDEALGRSCE